MYQRSLTYDNFFQILENNKITKNIYKQILACWQDILRWTLEDDFAFQLEEQERHYGPYLNSALSAEAAAAEGRNSATPTDGRRGSQPSRKASSKSSGSERSAGSGSRKSSVNETSKFHHHRHSGGYMHSGQRRLSASRHSLASRGSDL